MANKETTRKLPPKWGDDPLSSFLNDAFSNCLATFVRRPDAFDLLRRVDRVFGSITDNFSNPPDFLGAVLLVRSHSSFRAGVRLTVSGQLADVFPALRACLEYSLYAFHIHKDNGRGALWLQRHDSEEFGRKVRREFAHGSVIATLREADAELAKAVGSLYERTIDYGAHPNERGVTGVMTMAETQDRNESSIADQVRVCTEYVERQGWKVVERFEDQGISGAALGNRPGVLMLQEGALAGRFDAVVVMDLSRLSRSQGDLSKMIDRLTAKGVRVIGVQDGYDSARRGHKLQAGLSGIIGEAFREMVKDRTYAALESRARAHRATGGRAYGYRDGKIDRGEAFMVLEIFGKFADGMSARTIATDLNARRIPSPGSSWNRTQRRARGWMGSAIRVIVRNERYRGVVHWNTSEWRKDPDSGKRKRVMRPRSEWISYVDESLRIVSDDLWERAQRRTRPVKDDKRFKAGGRPKFLLSGLLVCDTCGSHYTITDQHSYGCSSFHDGRACSNSVRVRRDRIETILLDPIRKDLLTPERAERMAKEMLAYYLDRVRAMQTQAMEQPRELQELTARIERLRERLKQGDPDMTADEIQAAIDRAEEKRAELQDQQSVAMPSSKVFTMLPRAAEAYRRQITLGLGGDPRAALKARVILRELFGGKIRLVPQLDGGLMAHWNLHPGALLKALGTYGSGGGIR